MAKMWAGVTAGITDSLADELNSSLRFDKRLYEQDIKGSLAHAAMLAARGIISPDECDKISSGLAGILEDLKSGALQFDMSCEDFHMFGRLLPDRPLASARPYGLQMSVGEDICTETFAQTFKSDYDAFAAIDAFRHEDVERNGSGRHWPHLEGHDGRFPAFL